MQSAFYRNNFAFLLMSEDYPTACPDPPRYWGKFRRTTPPCILVSNGVMHGDIAIANNFMFKSKNYLYNFVQRVGNFTFLKLLQSH